MDAARWGGPRVAAREEALMLIGDKPKINLGWMLCQSLDAISVIPLLFKPSNYKRADRFLVLTLVYVGRRPMLWLILHCDEAF